MTFKKQAAPGSITSWSPSRLSAYLECPRKARYKYVDKLSEPSAPALERGTLIHSAAENYIANRTSKLHEALRNPKVKSLVAALRKEYKAKRVRVELELAFDKTWRLVDWFGRDVYVRFKVDVLRLLKKGTGQVIDWKTGRFKNEGAAYDPQLNGYATAALSSGLVTSATAMLVFTDTGEVVERSAGVLALKDLSKAQKAWDKKAKPMLADRLFKPKPGNACRWCHFSTNKGGPCDY